MVTIIRLLPYPHRTVNMSASAVVVILGKICVCIFAAKFAYQNLFPERAYTQEEWDRANLLLKIVKQDPNARAEMKRNTMNGCIGVLLVISFGLTLLFDLYVFLFYGP